MVDDTTLDFLAKQVIGFTGSLVTGAVVGYVSEHNKWVPSNAPELSKVGYCTLLELTSNYVGGPIMSSFTGKSRFLEERAADDLASVAGLYIGFKVGQAADRTLRRMYEHRRQEKPVTES